MIGLPTEFQFIFLGNTSFNSLSQREHAFAIEIARRGYNVTFVEGMPSLGSLINEHLHSFIFKYNLPFQQRSSTRVNIAIPPLVPTFFRSSYTPALDARIFSSWFDKKFLSCDWSKVILVSTFPYWWNGFINRKKYPAKFVIYDICVSLKVHSRNKKTLIKMQNAENALVLESDLITFSAHEFQDELLSKNLSHVAFVPNAISNEFFEKVQSFNNLDKTNIGFIGALDNRWIDLELIEKAVTKFSKFTFIFVSPFRREFFNVLSKHKNVELLGFRSQQDIPEVLNEFKIAIIPFLKNTITDFVNPLKLYEYCAAGIPILATRTKELEHYSEFVELADNHDDFLNKLNKLLTNCNNKNKHERIRFAKENTWQKRIDFLLDLISQRVLVP